MSETKKVKVLQIVPSLRTGGGERIAVDIAAHIDRELVDMTVLSMYPEEQTILSEYAREKNVRVLYLAKKPGFDPKAISRLRRIIKELDPDVIHTHLKVVPYVILASSRKTVKYHTVHNIAQKEAAGIYRRIMKFAYGHCCFTPVCISDYCAETFREVYVNYRGKLPCIMNGIDVSRFAPLPSAHEGFRFISVGRFFPQKNQKVLISAFEKVYKAHPECVLEIVGDGSLRSELEELVSRLGLKNSVIMDGESDRIVEKLNSSDAFALSSDHEGLPVSVLEAMACALPIATTAAGGVVDIVKDGENGFVVPVGDEEALANAMIRLVEDGELRNKMGKRSREMAEKLSIEECARAYQELYISGTKRSGK
jgi:glycosyltransferase involved in cell wall biosynthesis